MKYYEEAWSIAEQLRQTGHDQLAQNLIDATRISNVGTEICMELRFYLRNALEAGEVKDKALKARMEALAERLDGYLA